MQNRFSPLRYPGGKGKITDYIRHLFELNDLNDGHYVEPYAGGSAVALALLFLENASHIHINDLNKSVYTFWYAVLNNTEELCRKISSTRVSMAQWHRQKAIQRNSNTAELLELAYSTFFLNRTNRSGIINGGMIGGNDQAGFWKIDARFNKKELIQRIEKIAYFRNRISLYNMDACELLRSITPHLPKKTLIYLDPPYYAKGNKLYENHYQEADHAKLGKIIQRELKPLWLVSYDDVPQIRLIYQKRRQLVYDINYSAREKYTGSEIMVFSDKLLVPDISNPVQMAA